MDLLGKWYVEVINLDGLKERNEMDPESNLAMVIEDWTTSDILVNGYREVKFVFVPDPRNFNSDGDLLPIAELPEADEMPSKVVWQDAKSIVVRISGSNEHRGIYKEDYASPVEIGEIIDLAKVENHPTAQF